MLKLICMTLLVIAQATNIITAAAQQTVIAQEQQKDKNIFEDTGLLLN